MDTEGLHEGKFKTVGTTQQGDSSDSGAPLKKTDTAGGFGERDGNAVNIDDAKSDYESLRREMSRQSAVAGTVDDEEKGEEFDLTDFLSGNLARHEEEGFKPKRLGLVVKNLTVKVNFQIPPADFLS
jgi:hypothetical protein